MLAKKMGVKEHDALYPIEFSNEMQKPVNVEKFTPIPFQETQ